MKLIILSAMITAGALGQEPVRPVPPAGVEVPAADRKDLEAGLSRLRAKIDKIAQSPLAPDVRIFHDAVRYALTYNEFLKPEEIYRAKDLLRQGEQRADALGEGRSPWSREKGLVVRGYQSRIDDSVQPYGLVIPETWSPDAPRAWRVDAWFHGRSEALTEVNFLVERQRIPGQFTPPDTIVLHLYGRYCNANKFAGEVDLFEALADVQKKYRVDPARISVRGFSMGGAATWQFAAHHAGRWFAAAPGAGFSETAEFLRVWQKEDIKPTWWEQKLWRLYDATEYAANFFNLPLVVYSGEKDGQKQAADMMEQALAREGIRMTHIIGPDTAHRYHPDSIVEINRRVDAIAAGGRDPYPRRVKFTTFTLRYYRMKWVVMDAMDRHWAKASIDAQVSRNSVDIKTGGVAAFHLAFDSGGCPLESGAKAEVSIDGQRLSVEGPESDRSWTPYFRKAGGKWESGMLPREELRKRHALQGPIDDAFMGRFLIVEPTGTAANPRVGAWVAAEMSRAVREWRRQFRGEAMVKKDRDVTDADIASAHLILWGDPSSNQVLARVAGQLPVGWTRESVAVGAQKFGAGTHVPVLVYPNPLNPRKYVVLNSGFTFREYDYLNNARQVPKLPDYAVIDIATPPDARWPGKVALAGFFGERWDLLPDHGRQ